VVVLRGRADVDGDGESLSSDPSDDALARYIVLGQVDDDDDNGDVVAEAYRTVAGDVGENSRPRAARRGDRPHGRPPHGWWQWPWWQHVVQLMTFGGGGSGGKGLETVMVVVAVVVVVVVVVVFTRGIGSGRCG
jgi:hypothetical protein